MSLIQQNQLEVAPKLLMIPTAESPQTPLTEAQIEALISQLDRSDRRPFRTGIVPKMVVISVATMLCTFLSLYFLSQGQILLQLLALGCSLLFLKMSSMSYRRKEQPDLQKVLEEIVTTQDVRFLPPLLDRWSGKNKADLPLMIEIGWMIAQMLPLLNAENVSILTDKHRKLFHTILRMTPRMISTRKLRKQKENDLAVLNTTEMIYALTRMEDTTALPMLRNLATMKGETEMHRQIKNAAQESLLTLEPLASEETHAKTLLRSSTIEDQSGATLVRPSTTNPEAHPETLLRPSEKAENEQEIETPTPN